MLSRLALALATSAIAIIALGSVAAAEVLEVPTDHVSIQEAIGAAQPGDLVLVRPGTYTEFLDFLGKDITVISSDGPEVTKILGDGPISLVSFRRGESRAAALIGFTLEGGAGPLGGAVFCDGASPTLLGNVFDRNVGASSGGAVYCTGTSSPSFIDNVFTFNASTHVGGAITMVGGFDAHLEVIGCRFRGNETDYDGAAIHVLFCHATIRDCVFRENAAPDAIGTVTIRSPLTMGAETRIQGNRFVANRSGRSVLIVETQDPVTIVGNLFDANRGTVGPQIDLLSFDVSRFERNVVVRNVATPAVETRGPALLSNNLIAWNRGTAGTIRHKPFLPVHHAHDTIAANATPVQFEIDRPVDVFIENSIVYAPGRRLWFGTPASIRSSILSEAPPEGTLAEDVILEDPRFVDLASDLHLRIDSPAVDRARAATERTLRDIDGDERSVPGRPGADRFADIGADEMIPELAARYGSVGASTARIEDVLLANGTAGSRNTREVFLRPQEPITIEMRAPSAGPEIAPFALYAWNGEPDMLSIVEQPLGLGWTGFATPLQGARPNLVWNNIGHFPRIGMPDLDSTPAPSTVFVRTNGLGVGRVVTLQGIIADDGSAADEPASVTNAITLRVLD